jgi:hypothetical protein
VEGAIRYRVTVSAAVERVRRVGGEWAKVGQEARDGVAVDVMGRTPQAEVLTGEEVAVYDQRVDDLDVGALVSVVNRLPAAPPATRGARLFGWARRGGQGLEVVEQEAPPVGLWTALYVLGEEAVR